MGRLVLAPWENCGDWAAGAMFAMWPGLPVAGLLTRLQTGLRLSWADIRWSEIIQIERRRQCFCYLPLVGLRLLCLEPLEGRLVPHIMHA